jgi:hypothetical protein
VAGIGRALNCPRQVSHLTLARGGHASPWQRKISASSSFGRSIFVPRFLGAPELPGRAPTTRPRPNSRRPPPPSLAPTSRARTLPADRRSHHQDRDRGAADVPLPGQCRGGAGGVVPPPARRGPGIEPVPSARTATDAAGSRLRDAPHGNGRF